MKKHLIAFLSMIGLAGAAIPAQAQVLKGSDQVPKKESQIKQKQVQENKAINSQIQDKQKDKSAIANAGKKASTNQSKLALKQETLKKQNTANGQKNALTKAQLTKGALTKAKGAEQK